MIELRHMNAWFALGIKTGPTPEIFFGGGGGGSQKETSQMGHGAGGGGGGFFFSIFLSPIF